MQQQVKFGQNLDWTTCFATTCFAVSSLTKNEQNTKFKQNHKIRTHNTWEPNWTCNLHKGRLHWSLSVSTLACAYNPINELLFTTISIIFKQKENNLIKETLRSALRTCTHKKFIEISVLKYSIAKIFASYINAFYIEF